MDEKSVRALLPALPSHIHHATHCKSALYPMHQLRNILYLKQKLSSIHFAYALSN